MVPTGSSRHCERGMTTAVKNVRLTRPEQKAMVQPKTPDHDTRAHARLAAREAASTHHRGAFARIAIVVAHLAGRPVTS
jgi:hypothetical protein